uniref:Uncharacterized protein n=1 Tax=viral metagenome TaxID=1070528 RepID=A0A6M3L590_9ZZZZ
MAPECEEYVLETKDSKQKVRRIFITPAQSFWDPEKLSWFNNTGTEDLNWCSRVIEGKYLQKAGWKEIAPKKYPFMLDTGIFCRHIDHNGIQYPSMGEELEFIKR